jgi:hypothetical protein
MREERAYHWRHDKISEARKPTGKFYGNSTFLEGFLRWEI